MRSTCGSARCGSSRRTRTAGGSGRFRRLISSTAGRRRRSAHQSQRRHPVRFVRPATRRLTLPDGSWIVVRERLTVGEEQAMYARQYTYTDDGKPRLIFEQVGFAIVIAYLVDWSAPEFSIRGASLDVIEAAVK